MKEIAEVIKAYEICKADGRQCALATVVHVEGSSYRRPGARMLVDDAGQLTGAISGGCLEGDALTKAMLVLTQQKAKLVTYDTMDDEDAVIGVGLGCNGIIQVLIEPVIYDDPNNPLELLKAFTAKRQTGALVTLFCLENKRDEQPGTCLLLLDDETVKAKNNLGIFEKTLLPEARNVLANGYPSFKNYVSGAQNFTAFTEYLQPRVSLVIIGAGNDVVPLVNMAGVLGWQTTVIDGRNTHAKAERFIPGCQVILSKPEKALEQIAIDGVTAFLLMTHNYNYDLAMLRALLNTNVPYIGSLGPKKKLTRMLDELANEGVTVSAAALRALHGPAGLDIGAETPEEIALSILAEIKAFFSNRATQSLHSQPGPIHPRHTTVIQRVNI